MPNSNQIKVLLVTASAQQDGSVTRRFAGEMITQLQAQHSPHGDVEVTQREVAKGLPFIDAEWVNANFTPADKRSSEQRARLSQSDALVQEIKDADILLIASPIYNFSVPASLKAWIDMVARVGLSFNYTPDGPVGLLKDKKAYIVMASGGTEFGSDIDYASGYLQHVLGFIGIDDVSLIAAERFNHEDVDAIAGIRSQIVQLAQQAA